MEKRAIREYLIFVIFCLKKLNGNDFIFLTLNIHLKTFLQKLSHKLPPLPLPFESISTK